MEEWKKKRDSLLDPYDDRSGKDIWQQPDC